MNDRISVRGAAISAALLAAMLAIMTTVSGSRANGEELVIYGSTPADEWEVYKTAFEAEHPDITLNQFRDGSGSIIARILAERESPQADIIFDMPATGLITLVEEGLVEPYAPANLADLDPRLVDDKNPPDWFAFSGYATLICYNYIEGEKKGIPAPKTWEDLADPIYKGEITYANPTASGTGMMFVAGMLGMLGEEEGWAYLDALHDNIAFYTLSGRKPCTLAGGGEYVVGITLESSVIREINGGAPVEPIVPAEGMFWEIAATAMVKSTQHPEAARTFLDWASSREANTLYSDYWSIIAIRDLAKPQSHLPPNFLDDLRKIDFQWVADNRSRIGEEWQSRYAVKSEQE